MIGNFRQQAALWQSAAKSQIQVEKITIAFLAEEF